MTIAAFLFDLARLAVLVLVASLFIPVVPTGRAAFESVWPILGGLIMALIAAGVAVAIHAANRPDLWIYRSKIPGRFLLALECALAACLVSAIVI